jgi:hypothetical protein
VTLLGEFADLHERREVLRRDAREGARHPRGVALGHPKERRVLVTGLPFVGLEDVRLEVAEDVAFLRSLDAIPRALRDAEREEVLEDVAAVEVVREPDALRERFPIPLAAEEIVEIDDPVLDVAG